MPEQNFRKMNNRVVALGLVMALGPLTALSFGTKYADEETWERAQAALETAQPRDDFSVYGSPDGTPAYAADKSLKDVLSGAGIFSKFEDALQAAKMEAELDGSGNYTVLVPTNDAFAKLPQDQLQAIMADPQALAQLVSNHVIPSRITATEMLQAASSRVRDLNDKEISVDDRGHLAVNGAEIVRPNIFTRNGVVHVIDRVIM
jgi:uncharacterized surface protein with fasciclin (FAS1) repeats